MTLRNLRAIKRGDCVNVAVSELMKKTSNVEYGNYPKTCFYAKEYGSGSNREWTGGSKGKYTCINTKTRFAKRQVIPTEGGGLQSTHCDPKKGEKFFSLRAMKKDYLRDNMYYLTF